MGKKQESEIRPKGSIAKQKTYFDYAEMLWEFAELGGFKRRELNNVALCQRAKGLILQNPVKEDVRKLRLL